MGAPKQKWTPAEEAALKAGIAKHGVGKWSNILKDPEFSTVLQSRSNVDLKDKWRNINVMASGLGSRQRGRHAHKSTPGQKNNENAVDHALVIKNDTQVLDIKPLAEHTETLKIAGPKKPISRLDELILEVVTKLKEPQGSTRVAISFYIEEHYLAPPNFDRLLAANLKLLTENGRLVKAKHHYRLPPSSTLPLHVEREQKSSSETEKNGIKILTKVQIDAELEKMRSMTAQEAAAAAARAIAEAEAAIAEAEKAAREAEEAEAEAEAAKCFAEAAMKALKYRSVHAW